MRARGFTLIELMAVVMILAVTSTVVIVKVHGPLRASGLRSLTDEIGGFDRLTRMQAVELDAPLLVMVDLDKGEIRRVDPEKREARGGPLSLPSGFSITQMRVRGENVESGTVSVLYSRQGLCASYAIEITGPGEKKWLLVTGLGGSITELANENEAETVLAVTTPRNDAR